MFAIVALTALASAQVWTVRTQTNLLRQPETVAELQEMPDAPGRYLKFSCSVMSGPAFEIGLGARTFEDFTRFSADEVAANVTVALSIMPEQGAALSVTATPVAAQVTAHAFSIGGGDAIATAKAIADASSVTIAAPGARSDFAVVGAKDAIERVIDACPFKG